jgi:MFS family permease
VAVEPGVESTPRARSVLLVLSTTQALVVIDGIPVAVALPSIGRDLGLSATELQWVVNGYVVALAGTLLMLGRCADLFGRRRLLLTGLATLTLATLVAGLAPSGSMLVAARACQGLGAAMTLPASLALVPVLFVDAKRRDRAFAAIAVIESAAWIVGALLGGIVTAVLGWRFVFLATIPVILATLVLAARVLPESRDDRGAGRPDVWGAVSITACLAGGVYAISRFSVTEPVTAPFMVAVATCIAFGCVFWVNEHRAAEPLLDAPLLRVRRLWGASLGVAANTAAYSAIVFVGTLYLRDAGYGATATGMFFLALSLGAFASPLFGRLLSRYDARMVASAGLGTVALALAAFALLAQFGRADPSRWRSPSWCSASVSTARGWHWSGRPPTTSRRRSTGSPRASSRPQPTQAPPWPLRSRPPSSSPSRPRDTVLMPMRWRT